VLNNTTHKNHESCTTCKKWFYIL